MKFIEWLENTSKTDIDLMGFNNIEQIGENFNSVELSKKCWDFKEKEINSLKLTIQELRDDLVDARRINEDHRRINGDLRQGYRLWF